MLLSNHLRRLGRNTSLDLIQKWLQEIGLLWLVSGQDDNSARLI